MEWVTLSVIHCEPSSLFGVTVLIGAPESSSSLCPHKIKSIRSTCTASSLNDVAIVFIPISQPLTGLHDVTEQHISHEQFQKEIGLGSTFAQKDVNTTATVVGTIQLRQLDSVLKDLLLTVYRPFA